MGLGALALVGSGEYLPQMEETDRLLLDSLGGPREVRVAVLPTASGLEPGMPAVWNERGVRHFTRLGARVTPLYLISRADAHDPEVLAELEAANLFYFSGGDPRYAVATWRGTPAWECVERRRQEGAVLAGCSAGAMMLGGYTLSVRRALQGEQPRWAPALKVLPHVVTIPHFDRISRYVDGERLWDLVGDPPEELAVVGIDEETALVMLDGAWRVSGRQRVSVFTSGREPLVYSPGDRVPLPDPPSSP